MGKGQKKGGASSGGGGSKRHGHHHHHGGVSSGKGQGGGGGGGGSGNTTTSNTPNPLMQLQSQTTSMSLSSKDGSAAAFAAAVDLEVKLIDRHGGMSSSDGHHHHKLISGGGTSNSNNDKNNNNLSNNSHRTSIHSNNSSNSSRNNTNDKNNHHLRTNSPPSHAVTVTTGPGGTHRSTASIIFLLSLGLTSSGDEFCLGILSIFLCALISVVVGVTAGIAISIQSMDPMDALLLVTPHAGAGGAISSRRGGSNAGVTGGRRGSHAHDLLTATTNAAATQSPGTTGSAAPMIHSLPTPQVLFHHARITIWDPTIARHNPLASGSDPMMIDGNRISNLDRILMLVEKSPPLYGSATSSATGEYGDDDQDENMMDDTAVSPSKSSNLHNQPRQDQQEYKKKRQQPEPPLIDPPLTSFEQYSQVRPVLCPNGRTYGFDKWETLIKAFQEANSYSTDRFMRWNKYFATTKDTRQEGKFDDPRHYYEEEIVLTICPDAVLRGSRGPLAFVNAENIVLECDRCVIELTGGGGGGRRRRGGGTTSRVGGGNFYNHHAYNLGGGSGSASGSHFSFGPHAKNIWIRGVTFRGATSTSLLFHYDGAEVSLQDCYFHDNVGTSRQLGTVADVNSTSVVNFYRCLMTNNNYHQGDKSIVGGGTSGMGGTATLTSLSIRAKDMEL